MSQIEKLEQRLLSQPKDFTIQEAEKLLNAYGFRCETRGKTSGSAIRFTKERTPGGFYLHRPHPGNVLPTYAVKALIAFLEEGGYLK